MGRGTVTCSFTYCSPASFNHSNLKGRGSGLVSSLSFLTRLSLATLVQLPPSIIKEQILSETKPNKCKFISPSESETTKPNKCKFRIQKRYQTLEIFYNKHGYCFCFIGGDSSVFFASDLRRQRTISFVFLDFKTISAVINSNLSSRSLNICERS